VAAVVARVTPSPLRPIDPAEVPAELLAAARVAHDHAYAPYSGFAVGAALRDADGALHAGANVENASYGLGRCAEQSAVQAMATAGGRAIVEVVVVADADPPATPCGACRQVLHEFGPDATVYLVNAVGAWRTTVAELLPAGFRLRP
jgi:cytidine deaminase